MAGASMTIAAKILIDELAMMLRPAGGGIHTVSTGREAQRELQQQLYGAPTAPQVNALWRRALEQVSTAKVAILAIPSDTGAGLMRGAAFGPAALRAAIMRLLPAFPQMARAAGVIDVGDVFVVPQLLHDDMLSDGQRAATRAAIYAAEVLPDGAAVLSPDACAHLPVSPLSMAEAVVSRLLAVNPALKLLVLGGDHSVAWPVVAALAAARKRPFAILHPDAHTDLLPERLGVKYCFATWAYHANELIGRSGRLVQVGVRASRRPRQHWESTLGVRQFWAEEIARRGDEAALDEVMAHLHGLGLREVYLSNDIDGTDAGEAPATGAPEGGGLSPAFLRALIARVGREMSLIGADLVEVAPPLGAPEAARRTVDLGARYVLDSLAALTGTNAFLI